eukprot:c25113_g1_i1 orf=1135-3510(-)
MGQQRQQPLMGGRHHHISNVAQMKKYCIWALALVVPFLILFCIFPSGTSMYRLPYNHIVVSQLQVPSSHVRSDHENLASEEIHDQNDDRKQMLHKSGVNNPDLQLPKAENQINGRKPDVSGVDELNLLSNKSEGQISTVYHVPTVKDREIDEHIDEPIADTQMKKSTKKGNVIHHIDEIPDMAAHHELSSSGKGHANQQDEASLGLTTAKSSSGEKKEDISSLSKEINADAEDPTRLKVARSKQSTRKAMDLKSEDSVGADELQDEEEEASSLGKGRHSKKKIEEVDDEEAEVSSLGKGRSSKRRSSKETKEVDEVQIEDRFTESGKMGDEDIAESYRSSAIRDELDRAAEEEVSSLGKGRHPKQRSRKKTKEVDEVEVEETLTESGKMGDKDVVGSYRSSAVEGEEDAADLLFWESEDQKMSMKGSTKRRKQSNLDDEESQDHDPMDYPSRVIGKALPFNTKQSKTPGECNYFKGKWIVESKDPLYMHSTCPSTSINEEQECKVIKRRSKSTNWRWQPSDCNMEQFRAKAFLKLMQRKSLAFIGDKFAKAQMESLLCLLAQVERPNLVYNDKTNQSMSWHFSSSNVTLSMVWSPYLVQEVSGEGYKKLRLDKLDTKWTLMVPTLDVLVLGIGPLFIYPTVYTVRDEVVGCYSCQNLVTHINITNLKEISLYSGFRAAIRSSIMGVGAVPGFKGITFFLQPFGFEGNGSYHGVSMKMKKIQEEELYQARKRGSISNHSKMDVLHTNLVSMSKYDPTQVLITPTCLIPRPLVDTWNQFLQHTLTHLSNINLV